MNNADFHTQPDGFPLESDATLGFMQTDYQNAIRALAKAVGVDNAILTGVEIVNDIASDGWILKDGDIVFFEGGAVDANYIIEEAKTAKANQNGAIIDRYTVKKAKFGVGASQASFSSLNRISSNQLIGTALNGIGNAGAGFSTSSWVILSGLNPSGNGVSAGIVINSNRILQVGSYSATVVDENTPIYLQQDGTWTTSANGNYLKFEPYTTRRIDAIMRRETAHLGQIIWIDTNHVDMAFFPTNGFGEWDWEGWKIADGTFNTVNLVGAISGLTALQRV